MQKVLIQIDHSQLTEEVVKAIDNLLEKRLLEHINTINKERNQQFISVEEAATLIGRSVSTVRRHKDASGLTEYRTEGGTILLDRQEFIDSLKANYKNR